MPLIHEVSTMTSKGQITVPKPIRDALGVEAGAQMTFELHDDGRVLVSRTDEEHEDPAVGAYLDLLGKDIDAGRNIEDIPEGLAEALLEAAQHKAPLDEEIIGDVDL